jgi:hypothetical protein
MAPPRNGAPAPWWGWKAEPRGWGPTLKTYEVRGSLDVWVPDRPWSAAAKKAGFLRAPAAAIPVDRDRPRGQ